jgi:asparagine synthase (glutamine-hydrolysing)
MRRELEAEGATFRGHSDTEVMLEGFERWGMARTLDKIGGMFAIALWDRQSRSLSLIRDRLGKKPLYYGNIGGTFFFGSQPKSFFPHPAWRAEIDRDSLTAFMRFGYVPAPRSIFKGLASVRPAEWVEVRGGEVVARRLYWDARAKAAAALAEPIELSDEEAVARFETLLSGAVERRLLSDVPLGAFLSGGIDSSTIVALMQANGRARAKTFSIGFNESAYDESRHARAVAEHLGTDHHELRVSPREAIDAIPAMPLYYDEPFADGSQVPTYLLSMLTREHVTVALSGDGGDELLAGYTRYRTGRDIAHVIAAIPAALRPAVAGAIRGTPDAAWRVLEPLVPRRLGQSPLSARMRRFGGYLSDGGEEAMFRGLVGQWAEPEKLVRGGREPVDDIWQGALAERVPDFGRRMQLIDTLTYLPDDILVKVDRASMAVGLEARAPLLDHAVVEFTWGLPDRFLVRNGETKWLLRRVLYRHVPKALIERPKMGFVMPMDEWLRGPLRDWAEDLLDARSMEADGLLDPAPVRQLWAEHLSGRTAGQYRLWCVLMFQAWKRHWLAPAAAQLRALA